MGSIRRSLFMSRSLNGALVPARIREITASRPGAASKRALLPMSVRPYRDVYRRKSRQVRVGAVLVGGDAPITVQSMTNTLTTDAAATIRQVRDLEDAG